MGWVIYYTKWVKSTAPAQHNHTTTQPQHTTINMSCCRPTLQQLCSSPSMGSPAAPPNHGAAAPQHHAQAASHRACVRCHWFPCLGRCNAQPIKKQREGRGLDLRWPPFCQQTQQPTKSWFRWRRRHRRRRATMAERMWRLFWLHLGRRTEQKNKQKLKYHEVLNGHKTTN